MGRVQFSLFFSMKHKQASKTKENCFGRNKHLRGKPYRHPLGIRITDLKVKTKNIINGRNQRRFRFGDVSEGSGQRVFQVRKVSQSCCTLHSSHQARPF